MTEGRFETIHNLRPKNWDGRRHWPNWHHLYDCEKDHLERESCPFHDLRAGGQFQYEYWGSGDARPCIEPLHLNKRADGDRMDFALGPGTGIGGQLHIPVDVEPGRPTLTHARSVRAGPWTKANPLKRGLFSELPHMGDPEGGDQGTNRDGNNGEGGDRPRCGVLKTSRGPWLQQYPEHIPDPSSNNPKRERVGGLKTGRATGALGCLPPWMPEGEPARRVKKRYGPFYAGKPNGFTFNGPTEHIPDPYDFGALKNNRRPFRTWHTRTKWSMPVAAPWSTGIKTAEPQRGANLDLTDRGAPLLGNSNQCHVSQTIGKEAALLKTMSRLPRLEADFTVGSSTRERPPAPVRFKQGPPPCD